MSTRNTDRTELAAGLFLILISLFFGWQTLGLEKGTLLRMGPGFFPFVLCILLFIVGVIVLVGAFGKPDEVFGKIAWRGIFFILPAPVFFGLTVRGLGFVPSLFITALIASQASQRLKPHYAILLAALVTIFSTLVFSYALGLPFRRFGPWWPF